MAVKAIPDGYHTVTPYLLVDDVDKEIKFLTEAFGASVNHHMKGPDGAGQHAEVKIEGSPVMMGKAREECKAMPCMIYLYVPDADATYNQALQTGATSLQEPQDMFYGDRKERRSEGPARQHVVDRHPQGGSHGGGDSEARRNRDALAPRVATGAPRSAAVRRTRSSPGSRVRSPDVRRGSRKP